MKEKISCIYAIISPSGGAYIGSSKDKAARWRQHRREMRDGVHSNRIMNSVAAKYGIDNLEFRILELCDIESLIEREQWWMDNHSFAKRYNLSGIAGRPEHTPEVRAKISESSKGRIMSAEARAKISAAAKAIVRTPEWIKNVADAQRGKIISDESRARMSASAKLRKRTPMSQQTKDRIRAAKIGKLVSAEKKANMSAAQLRRYERDGPGTKSPETRARMAEAQRKRWEKIRAEND